MIHRTLVMITETAGPNRFIAKQASAVARLFSTSWVPSRFTNPNYDVEAHHRQEILDALRTVRRIILLFVDHFVFEFPCLSVTLLCLLTS